MPKFMTIECGDQAGYDQTVPEVRNAAHANDHMLQRRGAALGIAYKDRPGLFASITSSLSD
ncbi:hypothetical protein [Sphingopyxis sp.]|uniref:hypothetical protein n=1 Tax=Sphingopyxis sp. TaxID=1908224 RepID=UPI0026355EC5|nr:hypothetical protein [Sphingopyxis sp.]MCW0199500.1 hypothetical protein [Sphingopyxis sp.]